MIAIVNGIHIVTIATGGSCATAIIAIAKAFLCLFYCSSDCSRLSVGLQQKPLVPATVYLLLSSLADQKFCSNAMSAKIHTNTVTAK